MKRASIEPLSKPSVSARGRSYGASVRRAWLDLWLSVGSMDPISRSMLLLNRGGAFQAPIHALQACLEPSEESLDRPSREAIRQRACRELRREREACVAGSLAVGRQYGPDQPLHASAEPGQAPIHALRASLQPSEESLDRPSSEAIRQRARSRWRIRHGRRTCNGLPNVLSWCSHCMCRAVGPTPAVYNH